MSAFKPLGVYPCTVEDEQWDWDVSMEHLFGHLCSGTAFAHDIETEELLASRVATPKSSKRQRENDDSQILTSSRQGSVESQPMTAPGMNPVDLPRSFRDPDPRPAVPDGSYLNAKRRRVSPPSTEIGQGEDASSNADPPSGELSPRSTLYQIRHFLKTTAD